ncbi:MAG: hypothetical protein ACE5IY_20390, partial [bacterium]
MFVLFKKVAQVTGISGFHVFLDPDIFFVLEFCCCVSPHPLRSIVLRMKLEKCTIQFSCHKNVKAQRSKSNENF